MVSDTSLYTIEVSLQSYKMGIIISILQIMKLSLREAVLLPWTQNSLMLLFLADGILHPPPLESRWASDCIHQ